MSYLALDKQGLSFFSHHWFWGLRFKRKELGDTHRTFDEMAVALAADANLRQRIENQIEQISSRPGFIQALYWLFNWQQYRLHYYQLQAYMSWQLYQEGQMMFTNRLTDNFAVGVDKLNQVFKRQISPRLNVAFAWFSRRVAPFFMSSDEFENPPDIQAPPAQEETQALIRIQPQEREVDERAEHQDLEQILVTSAMLEPLQKLGVNKQVGEFVLFSEIKAVYHKGLLATHPDRAGAESHEAFIMLHDTYESLVSIIEQEAAQVESISEDSLSLIAKMKELGRKLDAELKAWQALRKKIMGQYDALDRVNDELLRVTEETLIATRELLALEGHKTKQLATLEALAVAYQEFEVELVAFEAGNHLPPDGSNEESPYEFFPLSNLSQADGDLTEGNGLADETDRAIAVPLLTQEEFEDFKAHPDYFIRSNQAKAMVSMASNRHRIFSPVPDAAVDDSIAESQVGLAPSSVEENITIGSPH